MDGYWRGNTRVREPWLIQRCKAGKFTPDMKTSDYLDLSYMGSAEFEFGAIPQFLRDMHSRLGRLIEFAYTHNGVTLFFLAEKGQDAEYAQILTKLIDNTIRLKERFGLKDKEMTWVGTGKKQKPVYADPAAPYSFDVWFDLYNAIPIARTSDALANLKVAVTNSVRFMDAQKGKK